MCVNMVCVQAYIHSSVILLCILSWLWIRPTHLRVLLVELPQFFLAWIQWCPGCTLEILVPVVIMASHNSTRLVGCTSRIQISLCTTSQKCSIFSYCWGYFNTENSCWCSMNQSAIVFDLGYCVLFSWKWLQYHCRLQHVSNYLLL